ncbi:putative serine esterase-domain-containing protein [Cytidiella melzeri]|nr:putative serine esterase-domain-containing protein [Cytidiella melzeri]
MSPSPEHPVHLLVLLHGMWGNPVHLAEMDRIYNDVCGREGSIAGPNGERLHTLLAQTNREAATYDGIDWCGERITEEVLEEVKKLENEGKKVTRMSVTGYSLGGLIGRYMIGVLHQRKFFDTVTPVNFTTVATPHIGLVLYPTFRSKLFLILGSRLLSRTGEQFYAQDKWSPSGRPMVEVLADPDRVFFQALSLFSYLCFYANAVNDVTVPYISAAVEAEDVFADHAVNGMTIEFDEEYAPLIKSYSFPAVPPPPPAKPKRFTKEWVSTFRIPVPPPLERKFPWNILIIAALPILAPSLLTLIIVRLSLDARSSRSRIKLLEKNETYRGRLAHVVGDLEKRVEDAVADYIDDPGSVIAAAATSSSPYDPSSTSTSTVAASSSPSKSKPATKTTHPQVTPLQRKLIKSLNTLPNLKKHLVYIHPLRNTHAVIIARDVMRFPHHKQGQAVLRHMADNFVM